MATDSGTGRRWRRVDGVLLLDKAGGMTSNAALQSARRLFSAAKGGHTGTLDPMATGLLPLCFGEATKFSADLLDADKTYEAELVFGVTTDTGDADGAVIERRPAKLDQADVEDALAGFRGRIRQVPPMYSALKRDGRPLYELARRGIEVERAPREVTVSALELLAFSGDRCRLRVTCSKGTYVRALAADVGRALGCGAHLAALRRTAVGPLDVARAVTLDRLSTLPEAGRSACLLPPDVLLQSLPAAHLDEGARQRFMHGNPVQAGAGLQAGPCRVYGSGVLLGLGEMGASGELRPKRLVVD